MAKIFSMQTKETHFYALSESEGASALVGGKALFSFASIRSIFRIVR